MKLEIIWEVRKMRKLPIISMVLIVLMAMPGTVLAETNGQQEFGEKLQLHVQSTDELRQRVRDCYDENEWGDMQRLMQEVRNRYQNMEPIDPTRIICRSRVIKFDTPPVIREGRTLFPIRVLTETFGATVDWDKEARTVTIEIDGKVIVLDLEKKEAIVDGEVIPLDTKPEIVQNRTVVPLRFILETMGFEVEYNQETGVIEIIE
jgi:hypothetical protein